MTDYYTAKPVTPKRRFHWAWFLLALLIIGLVLYLIFRPGHAADNKKGGAPMPVSVTTAQPGDISVVLNALGTVTPITTSMVRTQIAGLSAADQLPGRAGSQSRAISWRRSIPGPYQAALAQQEGQLAKDQALLHDAQLDLKRYQMLVEQDSIARQQLDTQVSLVHQDEGAVKTDEAAVANAKLNLVYCHITAPVSGRIGLRQVDLGNYVQASDTNGLLVITQMRPMSVIFVLPEDNLPQILQQLHAGQTLTATAYDRSQTTLLAKGALATLDNQVDTSTGTVKFRAMFDNADELLFPNQFVNIQLQVQTQHDALLVPTAAIQRGTPGTFVYLVKPDSTVSVQVVKLGVTQGEQVAITDGLQAGDQVVTDGADKLKEGAKVILPGAKPDEKNGDKKAGDGKGHGHEKK